MNLKQRYFYRFRAKVKLVTKAWHDRPISPLDTAIYWTEFAARHPNFTFRTAAADIPLYQYLNLDIAAVFFIVFFIVYVVFKFVFSICGRKKYNKPVSANQKTKRH